MKVPLIMITMSFIEDEARSMCRQIVAKERGQRGVNDVGMMMRNVQGMCRRPPESTR